MDFPLAPPDAGVDPNARYFPSGAWMYEDISAAPLHPRSAQIIAAVQSDGDFGASGLRVDFDLVKGEAAADSPRHRSSTVPAYVPDCEDGVDVPFPVGGALEGEAGYACTTGDDCYLLVVDRAARRLFEVYEADLSGDVFRASCVVTWDMDRVYGPRGRGDQCTSADASGLPMLPLTFGPDEVAAGHIDHALRFFLPFDSVAPDVYVRPATHTSNPSSNTPDAPPVGTRFRLRADTPIDDLPSEAARVVARAAMTYGLVLVSPGGPLLSALSDHQQAHTWDEVGLGAFDLDTLSIADFEVLDTDPPIASTFNCVREPP